MPIWVALLLGAVQGLAEFLPISSSGHLALLQNLLDFGQYGADAVAFDLVLHLGTLAAVIAAFWGDVKTLFVELFKWIFDGFKLRGRPSRRMLLMLLLGTLPLVLGALLEDYIAAAFGSSLIIGVALMATAVLLWCADRFGGGDKTARTAKIGDGLKVGLMQLVALFPGISRSGSTICGGLFCGFERDFAVRFAFLLSIPAVLGATVFKLPDLAGNALKANLVPYLIGFVTSAIFGYLAIVLVRTLMKKGSFRYFAVYCAAVGLLAVILSIV